MKYYNLFNYFEFQYFNFIKKNKLNKFKFDEIENKKINIFFAQKIYSLFRFSAHLTVSGSKKEYEYFKKIFNNEFRFKGFKINLKKKTFNITFSNYLKILIKNIYITLQFTLKILIFKKSKYKKVNLYIGGTHRINKLDFIKMFDNNKSEFNDKKCENIVFANQNTNLGNYSFRKDPIAYLICAHFTLFEKIRLIFVINFFLIKFFLFTIINRNHIFFYEDLLFTKIFNEINKKKIIRCVISDISNFNYIPLWSVLKNKKFKFYFFWNTHNPLFKMQVKKAKSFVKGEIKTLFIFADKIYIDTEKGKRILRTLFTTKIYKFNFYDYKNNLKKIKKGLIISIFDTNLVETERNILGKKVRGYWNIDNMKKFINDVLSSVYYIQKQKKIKIQILLKRKSNHNFPYEIQYQKFLKKCARKYSNLKIIDPKTNVDEIISNSNMVISYPWTNPGFISSIIYKKKSVFYDPTDTLENVTKSNNISLIQNTKSLTKYLSTNLKN